MKSISCLYYDFLRAFEKAKDGFSTKGIIIWYAQVEDEYPYASTMDDILGNWGTTTNSAVVQAKKVVEKVRKSLVSIGSRMPINSHMSQSGEHCAGIDGETRVPVMTGLFPGNRYLEIIPAEFRRIIQYQKDIQMCTISPLADIALKKNDNVISSIYKNVKNRRKKQERENKKYFDVIGVAKGEMCQELIPASKTLQNMKLDGIKTVENVVHSCNETEGKNVEDMTNHLRKIHRFLIEKEKRIKELEETMIERRLTNVDCIN